MSCLMNTVRRQLIDITCKRQLSLSPFIKQQQYEEHDDITHFGFENVRKAEKQTKVDEVFASVAPKYDIMNDVMSGGVHRLWKDHFISTLNPTSTTKLLDSAGGTGDIAFRYKNFCSNAQVTVCDINNDMLNVGKQRAQQLGLHDHLQWVCASAEDLPFDDNTYNAYTISFGIRNCTNIDKVLSEAYRVLQPGGRFMCLEFSHVENIPVKSLYDWYSFNILPVMGEVIAQDWKSYQYLAESIRKFPSQEHFKTMIEDAGFKCVTYQNLTFGVCAIHSGFKL